MVSSKKKKKKKKKKNRLTSTMISGPRPNIVIRVIWHKSPMFIRRFSSKVIIFTQ